MMKLQKKSDDTLAVLDTQIFVPALASQSEEARFYACAIRKCWKFVFSQQITDEYQRVIQEYGFTGAVVIQELNKLYEMNKYRKSDGDLDRVTDDLAPRKDRHIVAPCVFGHATVIVSNDRGILQRKLQIEARTRARVFSMLDAEQLLKTLPDCHINASR